MWAWQFLRRNKQYEECWAREHGMFPKFRRSSIDYKDDMHSVYHSIEIYEDPPGSTNIDPRRIWIDANDTQLGLEYYQSEFYIRSLLDPNLAIPDSVLLGELFGDERMYSNESKYVWMERKDIHIYDVSGSMVAYLFDVSQDLAPQLRDAEVRLREDQKAYSSITDDKLPRGDRRRSWTTLASYLWVLDATDAGLTPEEIRPLMVGRRPDTLVADMKRIKKQIESATKLRDGDYRHLVDEVLHG